MESSRLFTASGIRVVHVLEICLHMPVINAPGGKWSGGGASNGQNSSPHAQQYQQHQQQDQRNQPQRQPRRWASNFSTQRRERQLWSTSLQKVQALRRGGSWKPHSEQNVAVGGARAEEDGHVDGVLNAARTEDPAANNDLASQLNALITLTYPNSSIRQVGLRNVQETLLRKWKGLNAPVGEFAGRYVWTSFIFSNLKIILSCEGSYDGCS